MSFTSVSVAPDMASDAVYRLWAKQFGILLAAAGWTQSADTGQADWLTAVKPGAGSTYSHYEIWISPIESGKQRIYLKLLFGSSAVGASVVGIGAQVGFGSNGSGSLSTSAGPVSDVFTLHNGSSSTSTFPLKIAAGPGYFNFIWEVTSTVMIMLFSVERVHERSGGAWVTTDDLLIVGDASQNGNLSQVISFADNMAFPIVTSTDATDSAIMPTSANAVVSGNAGVGLLHGVRGHYTLPSASLMGVNGTQLGAVGSTVSITRYGTARNYMICLNQSPVQFWMGAGSFLMRYE